MANKCFFLKILFQKLIGVEPDLTKLRKYFDETNLETTQMNIVDYILYLSKQNCNYKKLMKYIKLSCTEKLELNFCPVSFVFRFCYLNHFNFDFFLGTSILKHTRDNKCRCTRNKEQMEFQN